MLEPCPRRLHVPLLLGWVALCALFFAMVEIQIEGAQGWAAGLPTWRVESHWLLDVLYSGRPLTGYHVWVFSFMALVFHVPHFVAGRVTWRLEARVLGCLMGFWIVEDFLWFVLNPAFGLANFLPGRVAWHKHWFLWFPTDYWLFAAIGAALVAWSFRKPPSAA